MRLSRRSQAGFTVLEMTISATVAGALMAAGFAVTANMQKGAASSTRRNSLATRAAEVTDRLARELTVASMRGEDVNGNGALDAGEDVNRDGRFDADWNVADGATESVLSYNVREHTTWMFGGAIRWAVVGGALVRTDDRGPVEIARGVGAFTVTRTGDEVSIHLSLSGKDGNSALLTETSDRRIYVRN